MFRTSPLSVSPILSRHITSPALFAMVLASLVGVVGLATADVPDSLVLEEGKYLCKISREYKLRECEATVSGELIIPADKGHLMGMRATLAWETKTTAVILGHLADPRPYTCFRCNEECAKAPETCVCREVPPEGQTECMGQVISGKLKKTKTGFTGEVTYKLYDAEFKDGKPTGKSGFKEEKAQLVIQRSR